MLFLLRSQLPCFHFPSLNLDVVLITLILGPAVISINCLTPSLSYRSILCSSIDKEIKLINLTLHFVPFPNSFSWSDCFILLINVIVWIIWNILGKRDNKLQSNLDRNPFLTSPPILTNLSLYLYILCFETNNIQNQKKKKLYFLLNVFIHIIFVKNVSEGQYRFKSHNE